MRRLAMVMALVMALVAVFATAALARNFQCTERPCFGTNQRDVIYERGGDGVRDTISGRQGPDIIRAQLFTDDQDEVWGNRGADTVNVRDGDSLDRAVGGRGFDTCKVDSPAEIGGGCNNVVF
jgi:hypothetical protein